MTGPESCPRWIIRIIDVSGDARRIACTFTTKEAAMRLSRRLGVLFWFGAAAVLVAVAPLDAESDRVIIERSVASNGHDPVGYCGTAPDGFSIWADYSYSLTQKIYKDKAGNITRVVFLTKVIGRSVYYGDPSTGVSLMGGPGEIGKYTWDAQTNLLYFSGVSFKVVVPGQGVVFMQTGHFVQDLTTGLLISQSGHNDWMGGNVETLCAALTAQ